MGIARNRNHLEILNIGAVVNCTKDLPNYFEKELTYKKLYIIDDELSNIRKHFDDTYQFIESFLELKKAVLVHCKFYFGIAKITDSGRCCWYFTKLHDSHCLSDEEAWLHAERRFVIHCGSSWSSLYQYTAYTMVKERRQKILPNLAFFKQLIEYEKYLRNDYDSPTSFSESDYGSL